MTTPNKGKVSVIIPSFNGRAYIEEAVRSAVNQTYKNTEIIVIDDGSTDDTREIIQNIQKEHPHITYLYQENAGLSAARNTGIKNASGEYIALLDSDDMFLPEKLEKQVAYLQKHPECDVVYCGIWHFYEHTPHEMHDLQYQYYSKEQVLPQLLKKNFINPLSIVARKNVFEKYGAFDLSFKKSEDWECWLRWAYAGVRIHFIAEKLAKYRMRTSSLSYSRKGEVERKKTTYDLVKNTIDKMSAEKRVTLNANKILLLHKLKLWYAYGEQYIPLLATIRMVRQRIKLKKYG